MIAWVAFGQKVAHQLIPDRQPWSGFFYVWCFKFYNYLGDLIMYNVDYSYFNNFYWFNFSQSMTQALQSIRPTTLK